MNKAYLLSLLVLVSGCGTEAPAPDVLSAAGVHNYFHGLTDTGITKESANALETDLMAKLEARGWKRSAMKEILSGAWVNWQEQPIFANDGRRLAGTESFGTIRVVTKNGCAWLSAYRHELLHWLFEDSNVASWSDPQHTSPEWADVQPKSCEASP